MTDGNDKQCLIFMLLISSIGSHIISPQSEAGTQCVVLSLIYHPQQGRGECYLLLQWGSKALKREERKKGKKEKGQEIQ